MSIKEKCSFTEEEYATFESFKNSNKRNLLYDIAQPYFYNGIAIIMIFFSRSGQTSGLFYYGAAILAFNIITTCAQQVRYRRIYASMFQKIAKTIESD